MTPTKTEKMKLKIVEHVKKLEQEKGIKVLLACETGSRACGFPSINSDYDVSLIYMHPKDWYVSLLPQSDKIDLFIENNAIDIVGWDLRKSLNLLYRSNAAIFERIQSPQVYISDTKFKDQITGLADRFYAPISILYQYLSDAKKMMYSITKENNLHLKKILYAIRSSLICKWVLDRNERPPVSIYDLMRGLKISDDLKSKITSLILLKSDNKESYRHKYEPEIFSYIDSIITESDLNANKLFGATNKSQELNNVFINWLNC